MDGAAQTLVSNVGQLVGEEFWHLRGVGGEVARLRNELATINALLRMQSEVDEGSVDHFGREWMKQLREVAYDAEDCVHLYLFRVRCRLGDHFFVNCKRLLMTLMARHRLAGDIRDLRALASSINEQHARYGFSLEPLRRTAASGPVQQAWAQLARPLRPADNADDDPNHHHHHQFVGNKAQAIFLATKVKALNGESDKQLKVISIVGFGGLGRQRWQWRSVGSWRRSSHAKHKCPCHRHSAARTSMHCSSACFSRSCSLAMSKRIPWVT